MSEYIKIEDLDDTVLRLNNDGWEITRSERKVIRNVLYEMPLYSFPEREKGEWIKIQSGDKDFPESIVCSKCKNENSHLDFDEHGEPIGKAFITSKFCPNCGADMRGEQ